MYLDEKLKTFAKKKKEHRKLINECLHLLENIGIDDIKNTYTPRGMERLAVVFLAVADVKESNSWGKAKFYSDGRSLKSRDIIEYINENFGEKISRGSYDDIRRKDLAYPVDIGIITKSIPNSPTNNPTRGYALDDKYAEIIKSYGEENWEEKASIFMKGKKNLIQMTKKPRELDEIPVILPNGEELLLDDDEHNKLQKDIVEKFLRKYGYKAEVLYIGDAKSRQKINEKDRLRELNFPILKHDELPDVVAYSKEKNWLYLIEAVYSSGQINPLRLSKFQKITSKCNCDVVYVSAFPDLKTFKKFASKIAWETEVWIADSPDHLIHFNGGKFLGPYTDKI